MVKIIAKAISLASAPALTEPELLVRARDWAEILFPIVPIDHLSETVRTAFENHKGAFPINAYDIKDAYEIVKATTPKDAYCLNFKNHVNGQPEIYFYIPGVMEVDAIVPCGSCRPAEFMQTKKAIIANSGKRERTVAEIMEDLAA